MHRFQDFCFGFLMVSGFIIVALSVKWIIKWIVQFTGALVMAYCEYKAEKHADKVRRLRPW